MNIKAIGIDPEAIEGGEQTLKYTFYWGTESGNLAKDRRCTRE